MYERKPSHCGTWYPSNPKELKNQLNEYLSEAPIDIPENKRLNVIICPHAGYSYSGSTAAYSYKLVNPEKYKTVFVLGPSHVRYTTKCLLTRCTKYETTLGTLNVDNEIVEELCQFKNIFEYNDAKSELKEHSIEMQLPYIAKIFEDRMDSVKIVPIVCGSLDRNSINEVAEKIKKYVEDVNNVLMVVSSDFCHYGKRFEYALISDKIPNINNFAKIEYSECNMENYKKCGEVDKFIEGLDQTAMDIIKQCGYEQFSGYLKLTQNTICGMYPLLVVLKSIELNNTNNKCMFEFVQYKRSNKIHNESDSSVGYAAACLVSK